MNMTSINELFAEDRIIQTYDVDYTKFDNYCEQLATITEGSKWFEVGVQDVKKYGHAAFKLYTFLSHKKFHMIQGIQTPSETELMSLGFDFMIPRFLRDILREMARPMSVDASIYIPSISSWPKKLTRVKDLGIDITEVYKIMRSFKKAGLDLVPIELEKIAVAPYFVFSDTHQNLYFSSPPQDWRLKACNLLRHNRFYEFQEADLGEEANIFNMLKEYVNNLSHGFIDARTVNGRKMFVYAGLQTLEGSYISMNNRFPSDEQHSNTPPGSSRKKRIRSKREKLSDDFVHNPDESV